LSDDTSGLDIVELRFLFRLSCKCSCSLYSSLHKINQHFWVYRKPC